VQGIAEAPAPVDEFGDRGTGNIGVNDIVDIVAEEFSTAP
jgi:hypothetical protein